MQLKHHWTKVGLSLRNDQRYMGVNETPGYNQVSEVKMDDTLALITCQDIDRIQQSCANNGSVVIINFE